MSSDWEVFASILVGDLGKKLAAGIDLSGYEVKSATEGGSYEYQYHKRGGKQKLRRDMEVGHLFFDHRNNLRHVDLRYAHGTSMRNSSAHGLGIIQTLIHNDIGKAFLSSGSNRTVCC
jgi:hypothetical protein